MPNSVDQTHQHLALRISNMSGEGVHLDNVFAMEKEIWAKIDDCGDYRSFFFVATSLLSDFAAMIEDRPISPSEFRALTVWSNPFRAALKLMAEGEAGQAMATLLNTIDKWLDIRRNTI